MNQFLETDIKISYLKLLIFINEIKNIKRWNHWHEIDKLYNKFIEG
jgi:hypothetical protein